MNTAGMLGDEGGRVEYGEQVHGVRRWSSAGVKVKVKATGDASMEHCRTG